MLCVPQLPPQLPSRTSSPLASPRPRVRPPAAAKCVLCCSVNLSKGKAPISLVLTWWESKKPRASHSRGRLLKMDEGSVQGSRSSAALTSMFSTRVVVWRRGGGVR